MTIRFKAEADVYISCKAYMHLLDRVLREPLVKLREIHKRLTESVKDAAKPEEIIGSYLYELNNSISKADESLVAVNRAARRELRSQAPTTEALIDYAVNMRETVVMARAIIVAACNDIGGWIDEQRSYSKEELAAAWKNDNDESQDETLSRVRDLMEFLTDAVNDTFAASRGGIEDARTYIESTRTNRALRLQQLLEAGPDSVTLSQVAAVLRPTMYGSVAEVKRLVESMTRDRVQPIIEAVERGELDEAEAERMVKEKTLQAMEDAREEVFSLYVQEARNKLEGDETGEVQQFTEQYIKRPLRDKTFSASGGVSSAIKHINQFAGELVDAFHNGIRKGAANAEQAKKAREIDVLGGW